MKIRPFSGLQPPPPEKHHQNLEKLENWRKIEKIQRKFQERNEKIMFLVLLLKVVRAEWGAWEKQSECTLSCRLPGRKWF